MPRKEDGYITSDTGNWNVASDYSRLKIMKNLYLADEYSNIAIFGSSSLIEELENPYPVDSLKLRGLDRLINCLILLIDNTVFAIKSKTDKDNLITYRATLKDCISLFPLLFKTVSNSRTRTKEIKIIPEKYSKVLEAVLDIKSKINEPLNKSHLIFTDKESFDPKAYKDKIKADAITKG